FGAPSTVSAALVKKNFGEKYYPQNLSAVVLVLIPGSLIGPTIAAGVYQQRGNYSMVYLILLALVTMAFLPALIFKGIGRRHSGAGSNNGGEGKGKQEVWS
ncbi:MAG TPA: hypothetical protein VJ036_01310, partial [bacterium]|nr:hypothetical protein [bacterium]